MTEHVHKWELCGDEYEHGYVCYGCTEVMGSDDPQIARCLNATERLSAEDARELANTAGYWEGGAALRAYANIMEDKDE